MVSSSLSCNASTCFLSERALLRQLCREALEHLHARHVIYRDLKPENVMIHSSGYVKIIDFGFAKRLNLRTYTLCGTPEYLSPEMVMVRGHGKGVDWWALGILFYEMVMAAAPHIIDPFTKQPIYDLRLLHSTGPSSTRTLRSTFRVISARSYAMLCVASWHSTRSIAWAA